MRCIWRNICPGQGIYSGINERQRGLCDYENTMSPTANYCQTPDHLTRPSAFKSKVTAHCIALLPSLPESLRRPKKESTEEDGEEGEDDTAVIVFPPTADSRLVRALVMGEGTGSCPAGQCTFPFLSGRAGLTYQSYYTFPPPPIQIQKRYCNRSSIAYPPTHCSSRTTPPAGHPPIRNRQHRR
jgi:hypothetical protein